MALNRGHHLYSPGRPSRWALAHILVVVCFFNFPRFFRSAAHNSIIAHSLLCLNTYLACVLYTTPVFSLFFPHLFITHPCHLPVATHIQPIPRYTTPPANNAPNLHAPPSYFRFTMHLPFFLHFFSFLVTHTKQQKFLLSGQGPWI